MTPESRPDPRPKGIRAWAHVKHPGVRLFRRIMDGGSHYPSGFTSLGRNIEIGAGIASVFATDEEWRSLNALIDEAEARSSHSDVSADLDVERLARAIRDHDHIGKASEDVIGCGRGHVDRCADKIAAAYLAEAGGPSR